MGAFKPWNHGVCIWKKSLSPFMISFSSSFGEGFPYYSQKKTKQKQNEGFSFITKQASYLAILWTRPSPNTNMGVGWARKLYRRHVRCYESRRFKLQVSNLNKEEKVTITQEKSLLLLFKEPPHKSRFLHIEPNDVEKEGKGLWHDSKSVGRSSHLWHHRTKVRRLEVSLLRPMP